MQARVSNDMMMVNCQRRCRKVQTSLAASSTNHVNDQWLFVSCATLHSHQSDNDAHSAAVQVTSTAACLLQNRVLSVSCTPGTLTRPCVLIFCITNLCRGKQMSGMAPQQHVSPAPDRTGYQGFGSFHSEDVEVLIRQDAATYKTPALPFPDPLQPPAGQSTAVPTDASCTTGDSSAAASSSNSNSEAQSSGCFGDAAKGQFLIDFGSWTFINHGAFGGVAEPVYRCADRWRRHCELQPLRFIDRCGAEVFWFKFCYSI